jgi:hypothetical protein
MVNSRELFGTTEYLTLWTRCRINRCYNPGSTVVFSATVSVFNNTANAMLHDTLLRLYEGFVQKRHMVEQEVEVCPRAARLYASEERLNACLCRESNNDSSGWAAYNQVTVLTALCRLPNAQNMKL